MSHPIDLPGNGHQVMTLAQAHATLPARQTTRTRTWHGRMHITRTITRRTAPALPAPPTTDTALPTRPAYDPARASAMRALAAAEHITAMAPMHNGIDTLCGAGWPVAELRVVLTDDAGLYRMRAYRDLFGGEIEGVPAYGDQVRYSLVTVVFGVRVSVWTVIAEAVAL